MTLPGAKRELQFLNPEKDPKSEENDPHLHYQKAGYRPAFTVIYSTFPNDATNRHQLQDVQQFSTVAA